MGEQIIHRDPKTGKPVPAPPSGDALQNLHYIPQFDRHLLARDFSRPLTIPPDEYEAVTGHDHADAVAEFEKNQENNEGAGDGVDAVS